MADDSGKKKDVLDLDLDDLEREVESQEYGDIVGQIRLMRQFGFKCDWERIGARTVAIYRAALLAEVGQDAVDAYMRGISGKTLN